MKKRFVLIILVGILSSCGVLHKCPQPDESSIITEPELKILSENCSYVNKILETKLQFESGNKYSYNLRLVGVWKNTKCFNNYTYMEFKITLGEPSESIQGIGKQIHHYNFYKNDKVFSQCTIEVEGDKIVKNYCLENVKITNLGNE